MPVSEATYQQVVLEDSDHVWELVCGHLREKPPMTTEHNEMPRALLRQLAAQLDWRDFTIGENSVRLRVSTGDYFVPDLCVVPREFVRRLRERPNSFEVYDDPVPLVVEVWSPSTGMYDVRTKLKEYRRRGDLEIWFMHPVNLTLTAERRQPDGSYAESRYTGGIVVLAALPGVTINLDHVFEPV